MLFSFRFYKAFYKVHCVGAYVCTLSCKLIDCLSKLGISQLFSMQEIYLDLNKHEHWHLQSSRKWKISVGHSVWHLKFLAGPDHIRLVRLIWIKGMHQIFVSHPVPLVGNFTGPDRFSPNIAFGSAPFAKTAFIKLPNSTIHTVWMCILNSVCGEICLYYHVRFFFAI